MFTPQQEAAQMFAAEQAAEVRTLDNLTMHNAPAGLAFQDSNEDLKAMINQVKEQYKLGNFEDAKKAAQKLIDEAGIQGNKKFLVEGEYHFIRASAKLGDLNAALFDRILTHKDEMDDESNLGEIYFRLAEMSFAKQDKIRAKKALDKSKDYIDTEPLIRDDLLALESKLASKDWKKKVKHAKTILISHSHDGEVDGLLSYSEITALLEKYDQFCSDQELASVGKPSVYCWQSIADFRDIAPRLEKNKKKSAKNIYSWIIANQGKSPLLNQTQTNWARSRLSALQQSSFKEIWTSIKQDYIGIASFGVSTKEGVYASFLNYDGLYGRMECVRFDPNFFNDSKTTNFAFVVWDFMDRPGTFGQKLEYKFIATEGVPVRTLDGFNYMNSNHRMMDVGLKQKFLENHVYVKSGFYCGGFVKTSKAFEEEYVSHHVNPDNTVEIDLEWDPDDEQHTKFIEEITALYPYEAGEQNRFLHESESDATDFNYHFGAGISHYGPLTFLGYEFERSVIAGNGWWLDRDFSSDETGLETDHEIVGKIVSPDHWLKGRFDYIKDESFRAALSFKALLASNPKESGPETLLKYARANRMTNEIKLEAFYTVPVSKSFGIVFEGEYAHRIFADKGHMGDLRFQMFLSIMTDKNKTDLW